MTLPPLWVCSAVAGLAAGAWGMNVWHQAQRAKAIEQGHRVERSLQKGANQAGARYADALFEQQETARKNERDFRRIVNAKNRELDSCRVDAELVWLLDAAGTLPGAAGDPAEPGPRAPATAPAPDSTAGRELESCLANYAEVCVPNALHLRDLRGFTRGLIRDYNRATGRE